MQIFLRIILFPFYLLYMIFGLITGKNNYYIIAMNTANCYNILKPQNLNDSIFNEKDIFFISGVTDAQYYLVNGQIGIQDIYDISQRSENLEDFLFDFIKLLQIVDAGYDVVMSGYSSNENIEKYKKYIRKGINNSKKYDTRWARLVSRILENEVVMEYVDTELSDALDDAIMKN